MKRNKVKGTLEGFADWVFNNANGRFVENTNCLTLLNEYLDTVESSVKRTEIIKGGKIVSK